MVEQSERFRVLWIDTDASRRIHFTAVFRWVEATELALNRRLGLIHAGWGEMPRRRVEADFLRPLMFDDEIEVRLWVDRVGTTSITYRWEVRADGETMITGSQVVVRVNQEGVPVPLSTEQRAALSS
jgi:acyl-CoA thioester hydrolase